MSVNVCLPVAAAATAQGKPLRAKRLYVLAALEVERFRKQTMDLTTMATLNTVAGTTKRDAAAATAATLDTLLKQVRV
jgi:hypothetical protein